MNRELAKQLVGQSPFAGLADLLRPAIAIKRTPIRGKRNAPPRERWWSKLWKPPTVGPVLERAPVFDELTLPIGASRFDAVPDVPADFEWPTTPGDRPMCLLAQLDLAAVAREHVSSLLPADGWLLVFYEEDERTADTSHRVVYLPPGELTRWTSPVPSEVRQACRLDFQAVWSLPDPSDWCITERMTLDAAAGKSYGVLQEKLANGARHYLLGYPLAVQSDVRAEAAFEEAERRGKPVTRKQAGALGNDWSLLLQLDTDEADDGPGWLWGDVGTIYFLLRNDDLVARRFDRTRLVMQCC